ncbi:hypothetical protein ILYODFUR_025788 [Ilyodon furcidens]|uniref:Uncharacterized protein n=1 Tax=Ilyodon furcidens TaxID=33524 RepID=A0ABV0T2U3_9TELE
MYRSSDGVCAPLHTRITSETTGLIVPRCSLMHKDIDPFGLSCSRLSSVPSRLPGGKLTEQKIQRWMGAAYVLV